MRFEDVLKAALGSAAKGDTFILADPYCVAATKLEEVVSTRTAKRLLQHVGEEESASIADTITATMIEFLLCEVGIYQKQIDEWQALLDSVASLQSMGTELFGAGPDKEAAKQVDDRLTSVQQRLQITLSYVRTLHGSAKELATHLADHFETRMKARESTEKDPG